MSSPEKPRFSGASAPNLEQQRKRAKELLRAHRRGEGEAAERIRAVLPRARSLSDEELFASRFTLSEAQFVLAREAGFASWPKLKHAIEAARATTAERERALLEAAVRGDRPRLAALEDPSLLRDSLSVACALGDREAALALLDKRPGAASSKDGEGWSPLLYLTCVRSAREQADRRAARVAIAAKLLECGADPKDHVADPRLVQGTRSALSGAVAFVRSRLLVELLLQAGAGKAENLWQMAILADAVRDESLDCLEPILALDPPSWELNGALCDLLEREEPAGLRRLIAAGADPNASGVWGRVGTSLHQALMLGRSRTVLEVLLDGGAKPEGRDRDGRTAVQVAARLADEDALALFRERGLEVPEATPIDRLIGACSQGDRASVAALARDPACSPANLRRTDHQLLAWAVRTGRDSMASLLLEAGFDPSVPDDDGELPLALAVQRDAPSLAELLRRGAPLDARDLRGRTALDHALEYPDEKRRRALVEELLSAGASARSLSAFPTGDEALDQRLREAGGVEEPDLDARFEEAADAICGGDLEGLRRLLDEEPSLVHARSPRPHRSTLLHYLAANGIEHERQKTAPNAVELMECLLAAGADPDALAASYGGGPAQTTLALLVSSGWPAEAGLQGELTRTLVRAGANPNGLDEDGVPLATALAFRSPQAVEALAEFARLENPLFAAAAGRLDLLQDMIGDDGRARPSIVHCRVPWLHMSTDPEKVAQQALMAASTCGQLPVVEWLLERGVDPNGSPVANRSALHEAACMGELAILERLLAAGVDPDKRETQFDTTVLGWAFECKQPEAAKLILETHRPNIFDSVDYQLLDHLRGHLDENPSHANAPNGSGSLLRWAAKGGMLAVVELLLSYGADRSLPDARGHTALDLAREEGREEVVARLGRED